MDSFSDETSDVADGLDEVELAALAMLAIGALDDAESAADRQRPVAQPQVEAPRRFEVHPLVGAVVIVALALATWYLFYALGS